MEAAVRQADAVVVLDLSGEVDIYGATELKKILGGFIEQGTVDVVINFKQVTYIDSSGIGVLIAYLTRLKKEGGSCKLACVEGPVRMVFELTRLQKLFEMYDSEAAALASY